jgi:hypothetical protein
MQSIDDQELFFFGELHSHLLFVSQVLVGVGGESFFEPFLEILATGEDLWKQEVKKSPELR